MDTDRLAAFVTAAEAGSLSRAAERLRLQLSTVSRQVADLEAAVGVPLLVRTGRGVRPTPAGERYLERARHVLRELDAAAAEARGEGSAELRELRLSAPPDLAQRLLPGVLAALLRRHPALAVEVRTDTRRVAVLEEAYDAVLRIGPLEPSELLARRVGAISLVPCAPPGVELPTIAAFSAAEQVLVQGLRSELGGTFAGESVRLRCTGRARVATFSEAADLAVAAGLPVVLPSTCAAPYLADGRLRRALPDLTLLAADVTLLRAPRHRNARVLVELGELLTVALSEAESIVRAAAPPPAPAVAPPPGSGYTAPGR